MNIIEGMKEYVRLVKESANWCKKYWLAYLLMCIIALIPSAIILYESYK